MAEADEMRHRRLGDASRSWTVTYGMPRPGWRRRARPSASRLSHVAAAVRGDAAGHQEDAVDAPGKGEVDIARLALLPVVQVADHDAVAGLRQGVVDAAQNFGEDRVRRLGTTTRIIIVRRVRRFLRRAVRRIAAAAYRRHDEVVRLRPDHGRDSRETRLTVAVETPARLRDVGDPRTAFSRSASASDSCRSPPGPEEESGPLIDKRRATAVIQP